MKKKKKMNIQDSTKTLKNILKLQNRFCNTDVTVNSNQQYHL
jgi:hypothetical protein